MKKLIIVFSLLFILSSAFVSADPSLFVVNFDSATACVCVEDADLLSHKFIDISNSWAYYENKFLPASYFYHFNDTAVSVFKQPVPDKIVSFPHYWKKPKGCATYHLLIKGLKPETDYACFMYDRFSTAGDVWCNGTFVGMQGICNEDWTKTEGGRNMDIVVLPSDKNGIVDIVMHCSNSIYRTGGIYYDLKLAERERVEQWFVWNLLLRSIFIGALFIIFIYQVALFFFNHFKKVNLYLALFAFSAMQRITFSMFSGALVFFPQISYSLSLKLELMPVFCCALFYYLYMVVYENKDEYRPFTIMMKIIGIVFFMTLFLPLSIMNYLVPLYELYLVLVGFIGSLFLTFSRRRRIENDKIDGPNANKVVRVFNIFDFLGFVIIFIGCAHDIPQFWGIKVPFPGGDWIMYGFISFVFFQSINTARCWDILNIHVRNLAVQTIKANAAASKFVPRQFINLVGKKDINSAEANDYCEKKVALLSADVRNFTVISEGRSGAEIFALLNNYFETVAPVIRQYGGFIEKVMGDGIIAVFDKSSDAAFECALDMQCAMVRLRESFAQRGLPVFEIGIGIHYGDVILGIVGNEKRLSEVVLSPAIQVVNTVESYNKICHESVIVSTEAVESLSSKEKFLIKEINQKEKKCTGYDGVLYSISRN